MSAMWLRFLFFGEISLSLFLYFLRPSNFSEFY